jgi:hypothetical protein
MALNTRLSVEARNVQLNALAALLDGGILRIYSGAQPASPDAAVGAGTLLSEHTLSNPAFGAAAAGVITANAIGNDSNANANGTAAWFRAYKADGVTGVIDGSVGTSAANLILNSTGIIAGGLVSISSWTHGLPLQGS